MRLRERERARARARLEVGVDGLGVVPRLLPHPPRRHEVLPPPRAGARVCALTPNARGVHRAIRAGVDEIVVFLSASESHNAKNLNRSVADSIAGFEEIVELARAAGIGVKGAIATAFGCPFEGDVAPAQVVAIARAFRAAGVTHLTLGDTTGMATPNVVRATTSALLAALPQTAVALHFHNTRGLAMVNVAEGLALGVTEFESSIGGTGGCPFAPGATGNVCTEDLVNYLHEMGHATGIDLEALTQVALGLERALGRELPGHHISPHLFHCNRVDKQICARVGPEPLTAASAGRAAGFPASMR